MITINLLPTVKKEELKFQFIRTKIVSFFIIVFLGIVTLIIFLIGGEIFLRYQLPDIKEQIKNREASSETASLEGLKSGVTSLNQKIAALEKLQKEQIRWSEVLFGLSREIPLDLRLKEIRIDRENQKVIIKGEAKNRVAVLNLENNLKNSQFFERIKSPLSNITTRENVVFEFTFYLKGNGENK